MKYTLIALVIGVGVFVLIAKFPIILFAGILLAPIVAGVYGFLFPDEPGNNQHRNRRSRQLPIYDEKGILNYYVPLDEEDDNEDE